MFQIEKVEVISNDTYFYRSFEKLNNQEIIEKYTEGTDQLGEIYFSFSFGVDDMHVHLLEEYITYNMYKLIEFDNQTNVLTVVWELGINQQGGIRTVVDKYFFSDNYEINKLTRIEKYMYNDNDKYDSYSVKTLKKCSRVDISIPQEYDREFTVDKNDLFGIYL